MQENYFDPNIVWKAGPGACLRGVVGDTQRERERERNQISISDTSRAVKEKKRSVVHLEQRDERPGETGLRPSAAEGEGQALSY